MPITYRGSVERARGCEGGGAFPHTQPSKHDDSSLLFLCEIGNIVTTWLKQPPECYYHTACTALQEFLTSLDLDFSI